MSNSEYKKSALPQLSNRKKGLLVGLVSAIITISSAAAYAQDCGTGYITRMTPQTLPQGDWRPYLSIQHNQAVSTGSSGGLVRLYGARRDDPLAILYATEDQFAALRSAMLAGLPVNFRVKPDPDGHFNTCGWLGIWNSEITVCTEEQSCAKP